MQPAVFTVETNAGRMEVEEESRPVNGGAVTVCKPAPMLGWCILAKSCVIGHFSPNGTVA
jgi:hypothetical protein